MNTILKKVTSIASILILVFIDCPGQSSILQFFDPFIGTENGGNVFLGAAVPFGMVKLGPNCGNNDNNSGYYRDQNINGFSHTHVSGTGGGSKYGNILQIPESGDLQIRK
jgi:putative alpha-1,2-mannosidase